MEGGFCRLQISVPDTQISHMYGLPPSVRGAQQGATVFLLVPDGGRWGPRYFYGFLTKGRWKNKPRR